jgi:hypothetical protein
MVPDQHRLVASFSNVDSTYTLLRSQRAKLPYPIGEVKHVVRSKEAGIIPKITKGL